jgi:hypothetical protein
MDTRQSCYLASKQDDFDVRAPDEDWVDFTDIPYVVPANDNTRTKDRLLQRTLRDDPDAITTAIVRLKEDSRGGSDDGGPRHD